MDAKKLKYLTKEEMFRKAIERLNKEKGTDLKYNPDPNTAEVKPCNKCGGKKAEPPAPSSDS